MSKYLKLAVGIALLSVVHGQLVHADQDSEVATWKKLVGQVKTLKVKSVLTPRGHGAPANASVASDFVFTGSRYRVDSAYKNFGAEAFSNIALSYDGKIYYELQVSDKVSLQRSHVRQHPSPYNLANPYTIAFDLHSQMNRRSLWRCCRTRPRGRSCPSGLASESIRWWTTWPELSSR